MLTNNPVMSAPTTTDLAVVRRILTPSYTVQPSKESTSTALGIHCTSRTGISDEGNAFDAVMAAFRKHFGARLMEVSANVCYNNTDFTIFTRPA